MTFRMGAAGLRRNAESAWRVIRNDPAAFVRDYLIRFDHFLVFSQLSALVPPPDVGEADLCCKLLAVEQMLHLPPGFEEQTERVMRYGFSGALGVYLSGELAHINWLISADQDRRRADRVVKLRADEGEIAHGYTLPEFRKRGMQVLAIRTLAELARRRGVKRLYSITVYGNTISERGISSAGLVVDSHTYRVVIAPQHLNWSFVIRGHRKPWSLILRPGPAA